MHIRYAMTHDMCRKKVCAVFDILFGKKMKRKIKIEEEIVLKELILGYSSLHSFFPNGICMTDISILRKKLKGENVTTLLPEQYIKVNFLWLLDLLWHQRKLISVPATYTIILN